MFEKFIKKLNEFSKNSLNKQDIKIVKMIIGMRK